MVERRAFKLKHAALISQTASGYNRHHGTARVAALAEAAGLTHLLIKTSADLPGALRTCAANNVRLLIVNAGDGTVCAVLKWLREQRLFDDEPVLALLSGGTTNMIHKDVGFTGTPGAGLRKLLEGLPEGAYGIRERTPLRINRSGQPAQYGFFFATNAAVRAILHVRRRYHTKSALGWLSETVSVFAMILRLLLRRTEHDPILAPAKIVLCEDGYNWRHSQHVLLLAFSLQKLILGLRPLKVQQNAGWTMLEWPGYQPVFWLRQLLRGTVAELHELALRGTFNWILDGEIYEHRQDDGTLAIDLAAPAQFLVPEARR